MNNVMSAVRMWVPAIWLMSLALSAAAVIEIAPLSNAELEARYRELIEELRCPKCQNQNLADSNSPIAADLREQVRNLLEEGRSDEEIVEFLVARYGEFVRYRPALSSSTTILWFAPAVLLIIGLVVVTLVVRSNRRDDPGGELTEEERARLDGLLADETTAAKVESHSAEEDRG